MSIKVRYFASLKELLQRADDEVSAEGISCVRDVWQAANPHQTLPENVLAAVNMEYVELDAPVQEGDIVAFFPPVTGG
ncbi:MoaD/ThiS family protein [Methylomarinum vadi]|uniref:MoaD/ThiS family protein n=1 Tax=Methylomarinum vadi TaxID=438855 RepID=UPI0004DED313|nr:MoaD/ThiS family protein [Methylomarinum vadi]